MFPRSLIKKKPSTDKKAKEVVKALEKLPMYRPHLYHSFFQFPSKKCLLTPVHMMFLGVCLVLPPFMLVFSLRLQNQCEVWTVVQFGQLTYEDPWFFVLFYLLFLKT